VLILKSLAICTQIKVPASSNRAVALYVTAHHMGAAEWHGPRSLWKTQLCPQLHWVKPFGVNTQAEALPASGGGGARRMSSSYSNTASGSCSLNRPSAPRDSP